MLSVWRELLFASRRLVANGMRHSPFGRTRLARGFRRFPLSNQTFAAMDFAHATALAARLDVTGDLENTASVADRADHSHPSLSRCRASFYAMEPPRYVNCSPREPAVDVVA